MTAIREEGSNLLAGKRRPTSAKLLHRGGHKGWSNVLTQAIMVSTRMQCIRIFVIFLVCYVQHVLDAQFPAVV